MGAQSRPASSVLVTMLLITLGAVFGGNRFALDAVEEAVMNKNEVKGKIERAKGAVKQKAGEVTGNRDLEAEGAVEHDSGAVRETSGKAQRKVGDAVKKLGKKIKNA
jgi:uncharacterized protein YjbJ (UPF0337 family)